MEHILEDLKQNKQISEIANIALNTITNKKKSPDINLIKELKERYDNNSQKDKSLKKRIEEEPLFRLSIEDFENMCKDESIKVVVAKALNINIKSLNAFCKHIQIFIDNIDSSPNTIKEKMKIKKIAIEDLSHDLLNTKNTEPLRLDQLPEDILKHITQKSLKSLFKYKLVDGIPEDKLDLNGLCENPNAIYYLITNGKQINYYHLSINPNPIVFKLLKEELKINPEVHINWHLLSSKTELEVINLLSERNKFENNLSKEEYDKLPYKINWNLLSANPSAIKILKEEYNNNPNSEKLVWSVLCSNPKAIDILTEEYEKYPNSFKLIWSALCSNPNPKIVKLLEIELKRFPQHINTNMFAFAGNQTTEIIKFINKKFDLKNYDDYTFWDILFAHSNSENLEIIREVLSINSYLPTFRLSRHGSKEIIAFLREEDNNYLISWSDLAFNPLPEAFALFEENLSKSEFKITPVICRSLSENPNPGVITLLEKEFKKNRDNPEILWRILSSNKDAIDLLRKRMDYENSLSKKRYQNLNMYHMINWDIVSKNPNAIKLIKERIKYQNLPENKDRLRDIIEGEINWKALSTNPSIFTIE